MDLDDLSPAPPPMLPIPKIAARKIMGKASESEIKDALRRVISEVPDTFYSSVAKTYARTGLNQSGEELRVQLLYVLNNLQYWRGPTAKEVKEILKRGSQR